MLLLTMMAVACWTRELEVEAPLKSPMADAGDLPQRRLQMMGDPGAVSRGTFHERVTISKGWTLNFKLTPTGTVSGWSNVLHMTATESKSGWGARVPAVFFHSNSRRLHVCMSCDGNSNLCLNPSMELPLNEATSVFLETWGGEFIVYMKNELAASQGAPLVEERVVAKCDAPYEEGHGQYERGGRWYSSPPTASLYTSSPWYQAAKATLKDVRYNRLLYASSSTNLGPEKGKLITDQLQTAKEFTLRFKIIPSRVIPGEANILHISETRTNTGYGARIPAVFFHSRSTRLKVCAYCTGNRVPMTCVNTDALPLWKESVVTVKMEPGEDGMLAHYLTVIVDNKDVEIASVHGTCYDPYVPKKPAKFYQSGPWHTAAEAYLYDVVYTPSVSGRRLEVEEPSVNSVQELPVPVPQLERLAGGLSDLSSDADNVGAL